MTKTDDRLRWVARCAEYAQPAITAFRTQCAGDDDFAVRDLIANLMHYAASVGMDPYGEADAAGRCYRAETTECDPEKYPGENEDGDPIEVAA